MFKNVFVVFALIFILCGCTNNSGTKELLEIEGYKNIQTTGYRFFSCSKDDFYHTGFSATKNNVTITGTVCEGLLFKGKTIRYD